nr:anti-sigma factor [Marivirga aurantiaca]
MGQAGSVAPPGSLKKDLFYDLGIDLKQNPENNNFTEEVRNDGNTQSFYPYLTAAASIIAILGIVLTFYYRGQWVESEQRLSALYAQNETLAQQYNIVKNQSDQYASNMEILRQPGIENVPLEGLELSPDAQAMVHWNKNTNEVYLNAKKMPANEVAQQYQLWAIVEGKPVDMGVFDVGGDMTSLLKMKSVDKASAFAVTLEPRGGSENPTMEKMYVIGQI